MNTARPVIHRTELPELVRRGKVRDVYRAGERMLIVATDRISAFDVVMDQPVPSKGVVLTQMTKFWLDTLPACQPHHLEYVVDDAHVPAEFAAYADVLRGRGMVVKRVDILPVECIVRGYIIGSGWKDYVASGRVSGVALPTGLKKAERLPEPIFTPSTKAEVGHDEAIDFEGATQILAKFLAGQRNPGLGPRELMERVRQRSLAIYREAAAWAASRGIILADTKFEFGLFNGELLLADEVLTPDSSRFWPRDQHRPGGDPPSFDKQFLRDYLESTQWNKQPPPPPLPADIIARTAARYVEAFQLLTGRPLPD
jgi:phosphoribosylaminoimidazole-succinocarboxamide synthase